MIRLIELFLCQKGFDATVFLKVLDDLIARNSKDNATLVEQAYKIKTECLLKSKRKDEAKQNNILWANYYLEFAESIFQNDIQGALSAIN